VRQNVANVKTEKSPAGSRNRLTAPRIRVFQRRILDHYRSRGRRLPWRATRNPWHILVSEVMLQQTQVERVMPKYRDFLARFPDPAALAAAPLAQVLAAWSGLGYNRRALALKRCAETLQREIRGRVPRAHEQLVRLPGVGPYTASAVCVFAFNQPRLFIETNIRTVYIHSFFAGAGPVSDRDILPLLEQTLPVRDPRTWYNALMDYGAMLKQRLENPSRRSSHYVRQSPFKGSDREIRGRVLRMLLGHAPCTAATLVRLTGGDPGRVRLQIDRLMAEGFITRHGRMLRPA